MSLGLFTSQELLPCLLLNHILHLKQQTTPEEIFLAFGGAVDLRSDFVVVFFIVIPSILQASYRAIHLEVWCICKSSGHMDMIMRQSPSSSRRMSFPYYEWLDSYEKLH